MAEPKAEEEPDSLEVAADEAIAVCEGDVRAALKAALVANSFLESELDRLAHAVSVGFMRGKCGPGRVASHKLEDWRDISSGRLPTPD